MILIVDDNSQNIFSLKQLLEIHKFSVDSAMSGQEALKKILQNEYSLIILDVQMPDMDGFEVAEAISGYSKSKDIPIIFLSAINTHKKYIAKGYSSGGVDYVTKPFDPDILLLKVKTFYKLSEQHRRLNEMDKVLRAEIEVRKKVESDLQDRIEELKSTLESIPQMAFNTDADGKVEFVNERWNDYSTTSSTFPSTEGITVEDCITLALKSQKQFKHEIKVKRLDSNEYRYHIFYITPVKKNGVLFKWVGIFTDIHEQKMASEILEQKVADRTQELKESNKRLEDSNNELQQFAFVASHDLQEPLRKIQVFSAMIRESATEKPEHKTYLNKIASSAERMRKMITDLLDFARPPALDLFKSADLNAIIEEVVSDLEVKIKTLNARVEADKLIELDIVPGQMKQLFQNLILNSLKFSRVGVIPEIHITGEFIGEKSFTAARKKDGDFYRISIRDNGIGFDEIYAERIFEIFQRLNQKDAYEGSGIGLSIVKKIIDRHNGLIKASSVKGEGTVFTFILPVHRDRT
jgi:signal transduction histidine kinase/FixJ family two-component response regulator